MTTTTNYRPNYIKRVSELTPEENSMWCVPSGESKADYKTVRVHYKKDGTLIRVVGAERTEECKAAHEEAKGGWSDYLNYLRLITGDKRAKSVNGITAKEARRVAWERKED